MVRKKAEVKKTQPDLMYNDVEELLIELADIESDIDEREIRLTDNYVNQLNKKGGRIYGAILDGGITY